MRNKCLLTLSFVLLYALQLSAHGYWLELEGAGKANKPVIVKLFYGDYPVGERLSGKTLDKMKDIKVYLITAAGEKQLVAMTQYNDYWQGSFMAPAKNSYEVIGINEEREVQDWTKHHLGITRPVQYLKVSHQAGKEELPFSIFLDARIKKLSKGSYQVTLLKDGKALPAQKLVLAEFDKGETEAVTDGSGKAFLKMSNKGHYILSVDWIDKMPGSFKGKEYETVRHRLDLTIEN